jgi:hypothetical protein
MSAFMAHVQVGGAVKSRRRQWTGHATKMRAKGFIHNIFWATSWKTENLKTEKEMGR